MSCVAWCAPPLGPRMPRAAWCAPPLASKEQARWWPSPDLQAPPHRNNSRADSSLGTRPDPQGLGPHSLCDHFTEAPLLLSYSCGGGSSWPGQNQSVLFEGEEVVSQEPSTGVNELVCILLTHSGPANGNRTWEEMLHKGLGFAGRGGVGLVPSQPLWQNRSS